MSTDLSPGFADPVSGAQACFRTVLDAMAHPGRVQTIDDLRGPPPLCAAAAAVLLTVIDNETPLWLDPDANQARPWIAFHTGAPAAEPGRASFAMALSLPDLTALPAGTDEAPETSATLILQLRSLTQGRRYTLQGPGLRTPAPLMADGLPPNFAETWHANHLLFPRGIDLILCAGRQLTALPRSVSITEG